MTEYLVIYEQGDTSWGAYSPGVAVVADTRAEVEQLIRDAIPFHLAGLATPDCQFQSHATPPAS